MSQDPPHTPALQDRSFDDFRQGTPGNSGQNIYVSRAGVLQRIAYSSVTGSGYVDIPFANSHDDGVCVPAYLYTDPLGSGEVTEIDTNGAYAGAAGDLTGDGFDDLVIANQYDGATNALYAQVYFGGPDGFSRKRMLQLWVPSSKDVVTGTFAPGQRPSIVFVSRERLRVFEQNGQGFGAKRYRDIALPGGIESIAAADLDGDGADDLVVRSPDSTVRVYWGGPGGIDPSRFTQLDTAITGTAQIPVTLDPAAMGAAGRPGGGGPDASLLPASLFVYQYMPVPRIKIVELDGRPHLFLCPADTAFFVGFGAGREAKVSLALDCGPVLSAAAGDIRGTGATDVVLAARQESPSGEQFSLVYWGLPGGGFAPEPTRLPTRSANDVAVADLDGSGTADVIVCQDRTREFYTTESLVYRATAGGLDPEPRRLTTHCALDVLLVRSPQDGLPKPVFVNHLSNSALGDVDTYVYLGGPDGYSPSRRLEFRGWAATELKFVDFFDSGAPDVYLSNSNENNPDVPNGPFIYRRRDGQFPLDARIELPAEHIMSGVVADLNRNGYLDLVVAGWRRDEILVFEGGPQGFGTPRRIRLEIHGTCYSEPRYLSIADLNRNGWLDLVIPDLSRNGATLILWGGPDGFTTERATVLESGGAVSTRVADLDGDGWLDLIVGGFKGDDPHDDYRTFVYIYWGGPDGYSNDRRTQLPACFAVDVGVADLNNDGVLDIVVTNYYGHQQRDIDSYIYWGAQGGHYHPQHVTRLFHHSACGVLAADFDENGYTDLAIANHKTYGNHPGESYVWHNGPGGFSAERRTTLPTAGPHGISHIDLGNVYDRGPEEYFESRVFSVHSEPVLTGIRWTGTVPPKTWVRAQVRTAATKDALANAPWTGPDGDGSWFDAGSVAALPLARLVQYRLALGATNSVATPRITGVELTTITP